VAIVTGTGRFFSAGWDLHAATGGGGASTQTTGPADSPDCGANFNHIPYKGGAPALQAVLTGEVATAFAGIAPSVAQAKAGKLTILGSGGAKPTSSPNRHCAATPGTLTVVRRSAARVARHQCTSLRLVAQEPLVGEAEIPVAPCRQQFACSAS
jgi:hypothetical protein